MYIYMYIYLQISLSFKKLKKFLFRRVDVYQKHISFFFNFSYDCWEIFIIATFVSALYNQVNVSDSVRVDTTASPLR